LCCRLTEQGTPHVDEHDALENTFPEHQHLRPQTGAGGCRRTPRSMTSSAWSSSRPLGCSAFSGKARPGYWRDTLRNSRAI
jgi:hypothetical protein